MRIAIDGQLLWGQYSGVERSLDELLRHLPLVGREHEYCVYVGRGFPDNLPPAANLRIVRTAVPSANRAARILWQQVVFPAVLRRAEADVLHAPGYVLPLRARLPTVLTVFDLIARQRPALARRANRWYYRLFVPPSARRADALIVPSRFTQRGLETELGLPPEKIHRVPLGVSARFRVLSDQTALAAVRQRYRLPERFVLFVGNLEPKKNLVTAVRAWRELIRRWPDAPQFVIAGKRGWLEDPIFAEAARANLQNGVLFTGFVPDGDLPALYNLAELFVFPSLIEGFGLPPLEAMACGTPVVASDRGALPEVLGQAARLVEAQDVEGLAEAMRDLLTDKTQRAEWVQRGLAHAARFSWEETARQTVAVYEQALIPPPRSASS